MRQKGVDLASAKKVTSSLTQERGPLCSNLLRWVQRFVLAREEVASFWVWVEVLVVNR